jgi:hypothetical protein
MRAPLGRSRLVPRNLINGSLSLMTVWLLIAIRIDIFRIDIYVKPHSWILYNTHQIGLTSTAMTVWLLIAIRIDIFRIDIYVKPHSWILYNTHQIGLTSTVMTV